MDAIKKARPRSKSRPRISLKPRPTNREKEEEPDVMKLLHVSVTILSLSGVYFKESTKTKNANEDEGAGASSKSIPKTTVVASFSLGEAENQDASLDEHVRSLPLDLSRPTNKDASSEVVMWPTEEDNDIRTLSTFEFERYFQREKQGKGRKSKKKEQHLYTPQSCRIQLAVCRNKRWFKLGDVDVMISGEERGEKIISVPLINNDQPKSKKKKGNVIPMARLKGETLKCGLGGNAALRVLVNVSEFSSEKILHPNLATVVSWEYDPTKAAVVKKNRSNDASVAKVADLPATSEQVENMQTLVTKVADIPLNNVSNVPMTEETEQAANAHQALENGDHQDIQVKKVENSETGSNLETIDSAPLAILCPAASQEPSEISKLSSSPPRSGSIQSKADSLPPLSQNSTSSRPENMSPQPSTSTLSQPPAPKSNEFSPIRVTSAMRALSPFRALSPVRQSPEPSSISRSSVLDRAITITSESSPDPKKRTLSEHLEASPTQKKADHSVYFIEHDEVLDSPPGRREFDMAQTRSSITEKSRSSVTASTEKSSQMSTSSERSRFSQSGFESGFNSRYTTDASSAFTHSHNSAFTSASGYSSSKCTENSSMNSHIADDMTGVMAELLEKSPSELYAIIHDIDTKEARKQIRRKDKEKSSRRKNMEAVEEAEEKEPPPRRRSDKEESSHKDSRKSSRGKKATRKANERDIESVASSTFDSDYDCQSAGESSFCYESEGESYCSSDSESYISSVKNRRNGRKKKGNFFTEKIFGNKLVCGFTGCGIGDKVLSYVDDNEMYANGKEYLLGSRDKGCSTDTWIGVSSSSDGRSSFMGSDVEFY